MIGSKGNALKGPPVGFGITVPLALCGTSTIGAITFTGPFALMVIDPYIGVLIAVVSNVTLPKRSILNKTPCDDLNSVSKVSVLI